MSEREAVVKELERKCEEEKINITVAKLTSDYFIYHEDKKEIILDPTSSAEHIKLLTAFILS